MSRNITLTKLAGRLRAQGEDCDQILVALLNAPERDGLRQSEVRAIARSAMKWPKGTPKANGAAPPKFKDAVEELSWRRGWSADSLLSLGAVAKGAEVHSPMRDAKGKITGWRRRRGDGQPFKGNNKALAAKESANGLILPWPFPADDPVLVVEGEADAAAALSAGSKAVVATPGAQPGQRVVEELQKLLAGRAVVLAPDPDDAGTAWREMIGAALRGAGCSVRFIPPLAGMDLDKRLLRARGNP